jgi:pyruvate dehydrogenase E1 component beta subunit
VIDLRTLRPLGQEAVLASPRQDQPHGRCQKGFPVRSIASNHRHRHGKASTSSTRPVLRVCNEDVPLPYAANLKRPR